MRLENRRGARRLHAKKLRLSNQPTNSRHRDRFPDFGMLDAMIASALKKLLNTQIHFRKRVSVEEQRAQKHDRFLRGRDMNMG